MDKQISQIERDEHDGSLNAKKVSIVSGAVGNATVAIGSSATIYAVVNTSAAGQASVVLDNGVSKIGFATVNVANTVPVTFSGNVTLSDAKTYIGLTTTTLASAPTLFAVVNTSAVGQSSIVLDNSISKIGFATVHQGSTPWTSSIIGNITLSDSKTYIGLTTTTLAQSIANIGFATVNIANTVPVTFSGNITLSDAKTYIGLTTTTLASAPTLFAVVNTAAAGQSSIVLDNSISKIGFVTVHQGSTPWNSAIIGNITLTDSKAYIGLTTTTLAASIAGIGFATVNVVNLARTITGNLTLSDSKAFIGLTSVLGTVGIAGNTTLSDSKTYVGLTTTTLGIGTRFVGLVTAISMNAGTTKTLIPMTVALSTSSVVTIAVPTGGGAIFKTTNVIFNSDATVRVSIKAGATYLTGNASIGISLNPGGGFAETGSPDSPTYIGLASGAAIVVEKFDMTGTKANLSGKIIYFSE